MSLFENFRDIDIAFEEYLPKQHIGSVYHYTAINH